MGGCRGRYPGAQSKWVHYKKNSTGEGRELKRYIRELCVFRTELARALRFAAKLSGSTLKVPFYKGRFGYEVIQHLNDLK
ncbi:hypothetical protein CHISP_3408 [Chitinispirillum alkaliphilum]|nr:hypothetical protein CHISP_3408 [Chitinispirillum alkaliphilum]